MKMLKVDSLSFTYAGEKEPALREVSFTLEAGEFALITGETGCGKSTLLRLLKRELAPRGRREGRILIGGRDAEELTARESGKKIGYVAQRPEEQTVTDRVWHELAFGLENLGIPEAEMRRRVAETAQFFGLEDCFDASPEELSGGKRQLLNLADYYVDSCFHPLIMSDEGIFRTQAWHYDLNSLDGELTYEGVVYSEMQGAMTLERTALEYANDLTFPGAALSYS